MDEKNIELLLDAYIKKSWIPLIFPGVVSAVYTPPVFVDEINFRELQAQNMGETFSEMLIRLIEESGEKNSAIYTRANIDRRHFSKIANHKEYQPSKQTALAFAIALKLDFDKTQKLLATAGYTLNNANLADVIVSFFIEYKVFDVDLVNQALYKYKLPLLGG
ncbi:MAG: hypothetical protein IJK81_01300 [Selenomonadaceae bacterium]|nr:hypothetical protein [Selenomonadaceae bacterium]